MKNYDNIIKSFDTNFEALFNEENLVFTKNDHSMSNCNFLHGNRTLNRIFDDIGNYHSSTIAHHDLSKEEDILHFKRGIDRLNLIKTKNIPILFVNISHSSEFKNNFHDKKLVESLKRYGFIKFNIIFNKFIRRHQIFNICFILLSS